MRNETLKYHKLSALLQCNMAVIYISREFGWTKSRAKTSPYSAGKNPRSRLSIGKRHIICEVSRILFPKLFSPLAMTLVSSYSRVTKQMPNGFFTYSQRQRMIYLLSYNFKSTRIRLPSVVVSKVTARCLLYSFPCLLPQSSQTFFTPTWQTQQFAGQEYIFTTTPSIGVPVFLSPPTFLPLSHPYRPDISFQYTTRSAVA